MKQHVIQEAWLKQFKSARGDLDVLNRQTGVSSIVPLDTVGHLPNLQSIEHEALDQEIESQGFAVLRMLKKGHYELNGTPRATLNRWVALHMARSPRSRERLSAHELSYDRVRHPFFEQDLAQAGSYSDVWCLRFGSDHEPLILADNPIVLLHDQALVFPFSPRTMIVIGNHDPSCHTFLDRTWPQALNEMSYANAGEVLFGHPDCKTPWEEIGRRAGRNVDVDKGWKPIHIPRSEP